jgi:hypothetical protein|tara:strand:+ start:52 stop:447 length:396 start_codon:yes stop_codon:yes gene_type:complete
VKDVGKILVWLPVLVLVIGLIGWVLTLRNDVTGTVQQIDGVHDELAGIHVRIDNDISGVNVRVDSDMNDAHKVIGALHERIIELEKSLAVASDQMQTIMGDHAGFADVLRELGESGALPSGERRAYGGYGN